MNLSSSFDDGYHLVYFKTNLHELLLKDLYNLIQESKYFLKLMLRHVLVMKIVKI